MLTHRHRTILGNIPADWDAKPLKSLITEHFAGNWGDDEGEQAVSVLRSTNFTNDRQLDFSDIARRYFPKLQADQFGLLKGDLLVERSGGGPEQPVGRIGFIESDMPGTTVSNFVQVLRPDAEKVDASFLGWALFELQRTGIVERVQQQSTQMRNLNWRDYQRLLLPWPKLEEQRRIAAIIKTLDSALDAAKQRVAATKAAMTSLVTRLMFDVAEVNGHLPFKYASIPNGWSLQKVGKLTTVRQLGTNDVADHGASHTPILKMADLSFGELSLDGVEYVLEHKAQALTDYLLKDKDFLFNTRNTPELVGKSAVWRCERERCLFNNNILRMRFDEAIALPEFVNLEFASWRGRRRLRALATGTTSVAAIYWQDLARVWIALPDVATQRASVEHVATARTACKAAQAGVEALQDLKLCLLQHLVTGRIRVPARVPHA